MSYLQQKSLFNQDAAELLIKNHMYASSVHCSYYSCFQFLKFTLKNYTATDYSTIELNCKTSPLGTHGYIINGILNEYRKVETNNREYSRIKRFLTDLKEFRITSDYYNVEIKIDEAEKSHSFSHQIKDAIKTKLK